VNDAATTWALVVGIDSYADPNVKDLEGAVADAVAFVDWLRRLGVPETQILLHASPTKRSRRLLKGRSAVEASAPAIDASIVRLESIGGGSRLLVYLAGHGLYEPTAGRLFLFPEFTENTPLNMGLDLYVPRFLQMPFPRQFLFVDGCQNLPYSESARQRIAGQMYGGRVGFTAKPGNVLVGCYAASLGELAEEVDGHGVFTRRLLEGMDLEHPFKDAVVLDFSTGQRSLDLRKVVTGYVVPYVQADVRGSSPQTPNIQSESGETEDVLRLYSFRDEAPAGKVTVAIQPKAAESAVELLRISVDGYSLWSFWQPRPPAKKLGVPFEVRVPVGSSAAAHCVLQNGAEWAGTLEHRFNVADETPLTFDLHPARPTAGAQQLDVRTIDATGGTVSHQFSYDDLARTTGLTEDVADLGARAGGASFNRREIGPILTMSGGGAKAIDALVASRRLASDWAQAILHATPEHVGVATSATANAAEAFRPRLTVTLPTGGATALAGPIAGRDLVWIGYPEDAPTDPLYESSVGEGPPGARSLASLEAEPFVDVEPGHVLVRLDLPWGSWSQTVSAPPAGATEVKVPSSVGRPPLRVRLFKELQREGSYVLGPAGRPPAIKLRDGLWGSQSSPFHQIRPRSAKWALGPPRVGWLREDDAVGVATAGSFSFPFVHGRSLGFERIGPDLLVEPLSPVPSTGWDLLLAGGLLDALPPQKVVELTYAKWDDALLGLAGAYAVYARPADEETDRDLQTVLRNLKRLAGQRRGRRVPDIDLLRAALTTRRNKKLSRPDHVALEGWAIRGAVPILRWGVPLAIRLVEDGVLSGDAFDRWIDELRRIEDTLSAHSVWTVWRARARS